MNNQEQIQYRTMHCKVVAKNSQLLVYSTLRGKPDQPMLMGTYTMREMDRAIRHCDNCEDSTSLL